MDLLLLYSCAKSNSREVTAVKGHLGHPKRSDKAVQTHKKGRRMFMSSVLQCLQRSSAHDLGSSTA